MRAYGDFLSYCLLAEGAVDIAAEPEVSVWDLAALDILVREAGGQFTGLDGTAGPHGGSAVATNGLLHQQVLERPAPCELVNTALSILLRSKIRLYRIAPTTEAAEMTDTASKTPRRSRAKRRDRQTAVGMQPHKRTGDRHRHRAAHADRRPGVPGQIQPARSAQPGVCATATKTLFSTTAAATRQFKRVQNLRGGPTRLKSSGKDYFDLTPDDDQKMIVETVDEFAAEVLRPAAHDADEAAAIRPI